MLKKRSLVLLCLVALGIFLTQPRLGVVPVLANEGGPPPVVQESPTPFVIEPQPTDLLAQGEALYAASRFREAILVYSQAVSEYARRGARLQQAAALSNLALAQSQLGQGHEADQSISASLNLVQSSANAANATERQVFAQILEIQGQLQLRARQVEAALNSWQQAGQIYQQIKDLKGMVRSLINQAQAQQNLGFYRRALTTLNQAKAIVAAQPNSTAKAATLHSLGNALRLTGNLDASEQVLKQSLAIANQLQSPAIISSTYLSLGNTYRDLGTTLRERQDLTTDAAATPLQCQQPLLSAQVQEWYRQAQNAYLQAATNPGAPSQNRIQAQLNQLDILVTTREWQPAVRVWGQIQPQLVDLPPSQSATFARINAARTLACLKQTSPQATLTWSDIARPLATAVTESRMSGDLRSQAYALGYLGSIYRLTRQPGPAKDLTQQALLIAQSLSAPDIAYRWQWQLGQLLEEEGNFTGAIAAYNDAVSSLHALRSDLSAINPEAQFSFRDQVEPIYRQLVKLLLVADAGQQPQQVKLSQARNVIESLQLAELENFFRAACLDTRPVQIDRVDKNAAVLYPVVVGNLLKTIVSLPEQPLTLATTQLEPTWEATLERFQQSLTQRNDPRFLSFSQQVYNWVLRPVEPVLKTSGVKTLVFVLDSPLRNIPMATLHDGQQYLVEKYSLALTPGLQLLPSQPLERQQLRALLAGLTEARQGFPALRFVDQEFAQIRTELPSQELLNQSFTDNNLRSQVNAANFPIVHLATHGQFSSQAEDTFILTWDQRLDIDQLNALLRRRTGGQPIELLVLSACETATSDRRAALGLAGIAVRAGARSTLASLWLVNDKAASSLIGRFYKELADIRVTKAEALRKAQLSLLRQEEYRHPYFWSSFVLIGNWL
jgi:CHAT domain-containing protein